MPTPTINFAKLTDETSATILKKYGIGLTIDEARNFQKQIRRPPTVTEAIMCGIQNSEHSSYKSSRKWLKLLPTRAPHVILGPGEDAGIVEIAKIKGKRYGLVLSHESHNHPSQVVPYEGAATGIGGCVRDVICMGARVIANADPLRFGDIEKNHSKLIAEGVIDGIAGYGNPIGVPVIAGDVYFNRSFNENCLVNVVSVGILEESEIIRSRAPKGAGEKKYDIILVGKATDNSGMGAAAFASLTLKKEERESNKGFVQEPNPFLKRHLFCATYDLFEMLKEKDLLKKVALKDLGAGGIMCATSELVHAAGYGADIDLDKVPTAIQNLPPAVIACAETQERFCWIAPKDVTPLILETYNVKWELPKIAKDAQATVIGTVTKGKYTLRHKGKVVCDLAPKVLTQGFSYDRDYEKPVKHFKEPNLDLPGNLAEIFLQVLAHENVASRKPVYESYDKNVQGITKIEPGEADAGVIAPLLNRKDVPEEKRNLGIAISVDSNPAYGRIDPYWGAANAVLEGMRNVAAVGATPWCITDCLNYGNPENPPRMWEFVQGVKGITDALKGVGITVPVISGNVSFYNESPAGTIDPSAIIATVGRLDDCEKAITTKLKTTASELYLVGLRKNELGASVYYRVRKKMGANVPKPKFAEARAEIFTVIDAIAGGYVLACHDISEGGLATTIAEMCMSDIGIDVDVKNAAEEKLRIDQKLFSETGGFVLEIRKKDVPEVENIMKRHKTSFVRLGRTTKEHRFIVREKGKLIFNLPLKEIRRAWLHGLRDKMQ